MTADTGEGLHTHVPLFKDSMDASSVVLSALGEWLADSIFDEQEPAGMPSRPAAASEELLMLQHLQRWSSIEG